MSSIDDDLSQVNPLRVLYPFMFTGIIEKMGTILQTRDETYGKSISVHCHAWESPIQRGESIALSGCCLTVTDTESQGESLTLSFDVIPETLSKTTIRSWSVGDCVNIERAITAGTPLGGHIVQGHIDYIASIKDKTTTDGVYVITMSIPTGMACKIVEKGCIAINGVSLTISSCSEGSFTVSLIPETLEMTNLSLLQTGDTVNVETDIMTRSIASVVEKVLASKQHV